MLAGIIGQPGITKPELCRQTGLPVSTVHHAVQALLARALIVEMGTAASGGGRCPIRYEVNGGAGVVAALSVRLDHVDAGV